MFVFKKIIFQVVFLCVAMAALYGQFFSNPIIFDDLPYFMQDDDGNQPISGYHFKLFELRSLPFATLAWTKDWFGLDLIPFRIGNLLLHAAVVLVLFSFLLTLFNALMGPGRQNDLSPRWAAFFAALLFALHPVSTYAVGYLTQRAIVMATLFSLLAMLAYVQGCLRQKALWLSVPLYYLAVYSKEQAIMLPAMMVALTVLLHDDWRVKLKQRWAIFAVMTVIAVLAILAKKHLIGSIYLVNGSDQWSDEVRNLSYPLSFLMQSRHFFLYAFHWVFPNPAWMSIDMPQLFPHSFFSLYLLAGAGFVAWGGLAIWLLFKRGTAGLAGFALITPWLMFWVELSLVRIQDVFVLYRSYLWAPVAFALLPIVLQKLKLNGRTAAFMLTVLALAMIPMSMDRLATLSHPALLWDDAEKLVKGRTDLPGAHRIYYNRGTELIKIDKPDEAIADLKRSIALSRDFAEAHGNLGAAYFKKADWPSAATSFSRALQITYDNGKPISPRYIYGRAQAYENMGQMDRAQADYKVSCLLVKRGCEKLTPAP